MRYLIASVLLLSFVSVAGADDFAAKLQYQREQARQRAIRERQSQINQQRALQQTQWNQFRQVYPFGVFKYSDAPRINYSTNVVVPQYYYNPYPAVDLNYYGHRIYVPMGPNYPPYWRP